jgi:hypothetical protein
MRRLLKRWLMLWLLPPIALVLSAGMCTTAGNCSAIPFKEYDQQFTDEWLLQTAAIPDGSAVARYMTDAKALRNAVRACKDRGS